MARWMAVLLSVAVVPAAGQTVQKCVDRNSAITLTSGACPAGQRDAASYDATPERVTPEQLQRQAELTRWEAAQQQRRSAQTAPVYYSAPGRTGHPDTRDAKRPSAGGMLKSNVSV